MGYNGNNNNGNGNQNHSKNEDLSKVAALAVTMSGRAPSSVKWQYTEDMICEEVKNLLTSLVPDITQVTIETEKDVVYAYAWLPNTSSHIVNQNSKGSVLGNRVIREFSKELKELMDKYCDKDSKRLLADTTQGSRLAGIKINLRKIFMVVMDVEGNYAKQTCGNFVKSKLDLTAVFASNNGDKYAKFAYVEVEKYTSFRNNKKPRPTKSFNY